MKTRNDMTILNKIMKTYKELNNETEQGFIATEKCLKGYLDNEVAVKSFNIEETEFKTWIKIEFVNGNNYSL